MIPDPERNCILDIYILITDVKNFETMQKLYKLVDAEIKINLDPKRHHYEKLRGSPKSDRSNASENFRENYELPKKFTFNDIKDCLNGYARIISYESVYCDYYNKDLSLLQIVKIDEGMHQNG